MIFCSHVTGRALRAHNADMSEQAWEQRAVERLPRTPHTYLAASSTIYLNSSLRGTHCEKENPGTQMPDTRGTLRL